MPLTRAMKNRNRAAFNAIEKIVDDLTDRRGLRQVWESLDVDIRAEIKADWRRIIVEASVSKGEMMGWAHCGTDDLGREIGYAVEAECDMPGCDAKIDRGLGYVCGPMHGYSEWGCAGYFCGKHLDQEDHKCDGEKRGD